MKKGVELSQLLDKISGYKKKYYKNLLFKGLLIGSSLLLGAYLLINLLEYYGRFGSTSRAILLISFLLLAIYTLFFYILKPVFYLFKINEPLSDHQAAQQIGQFFPNIKDKLLNTLQLATSLSESDNALLEASIAQKTKDLKLFQFADAVNLNENKKYLKYVIPPVLAIILISAIAPSIFKSTERIVYFKKNFAEPAPFHFEILNKDLKAVKNEDFKLNLKLVGNAIPEEVYLISNDRKFKMDIKDTRNFEYTFSNVQESTDFHFEGGGFTSNTFNLDLISRPSLLSFSVDLKYPSYLNKTSEEFDNVGNLIVPEGTQIDWKFKTDETEALKIIFDEKNSVEVTKGMFSDFRFGKKIKQSAAYEISLKNKISANADKISYYINVIPDKYPLISLEQIKDTTLYNYIGIGGSVSDDYGLTDFKFFYRKKSSGKSTEPFKAADVPFNKSSLSQTFFYQVNIQSLGLDKADQLEYYLQITDNDGVNGRKSTKTSIQNFAMPTALEFDKDIDKQIEKTEDKFEDVLKKSKDFKKALDALDKDLKKKKELDFQDKKEIDDLLKKKQELMDDLKELQKELDQLKDKQNRFEKQSPELQEKMEMLQKMIEELMKTEDTKMLEELKKMMEQQLDDKSLNQLDKINKNERNLDKNIDRTLKLFKNLQLKQKVNEVVKDLEKLAEKQEELAEKTEENKKPNEDLKKEQEKLNKEFEEKKEKLKDIDKLSKELKKEVDTQEEKQEEISKDQEKAKKDLDNKDSKPASENQKKAAKKMKKMAGELQEAMQSGEMKQLDIDIDALREILENLIKVSHDQENIMKSFRSISLADPRFIKLSQEQLKIADDAKVIEDSLYSLAKRVMQIESFITTEVTDMRNNIDESVQYIKDRKLPQTASKQQFAMTSMNNLALMLSDTFKQMQQMMANMSDPGSGKGNKPGDNPMPTGEQQKELNKKIQGLGSSGMGGKQLSEELAKLANEQAKLRKQLQEMKDKLNGTEAGKKVGNTLDELQKQMDESENDLVNKRINPTLFNRQKQIETRLLETEKAIKEQELDPKRNAKTGVTFNRATPPDLEKFKREKEKQVELLRTTPPNFTPFYKKQTDNYFKRIN
jgi:hypothetical protein